MCAFAADQELQGYYVQLAEIEVDPAQLENYNFAVSEQMETAVRVEPGVLVLYASIFNMMVLAVGWPSSEIVRLVHITSVTSLTGS